jgi:hypothetical protein
VRSEILKAPAELADLRERVATVRCDGCGAAVDLAKGSTCTYCRAPVSALDPQHIDQVVRDLRAAEAHGHTIAPDLMTRLAIDRLAVDDLLQTVEREGGSDLGIGAGLIGAGIATVVGMLAGGD